MSRIVLDSTPLGLVLQKGTYPQANACRAWLERITIAGHRVVIPDLIDFEVRRELLRLGRKTAVDWLNRLYENPQIDRLPVKPGGASQGRGTMG
jgi:predicted nucleic acid-binding protein